MSQNNVEILIYEFIDFLNNNILLSSLNNDFPNCNLSFDCCLWSDGYLLNDSCDTNENICIPPIKSY